MTNALIRSAPCGECGGEMLWTQNAWKIGDSGRAAYQCTKGHLLDPSFSRQCPECGTHDTLLVSEAEARQQFRCSRCSHVFHFPPDALLVPP